MRAILYPRPYTGSAHRDSSPWYMEASLESHNLREKEAAQPHSTYQGADASHRART
ncbi:protein of unknown function (plasmid) [Pararobbsia alpina]